MEKIVVETDLKYVIHVRYRAKLCDTYCTLKYSNDY